MMRPIIDEVCQTLGDVVYGVDVGTLENAVFQLLKAQGKTLAAAESCTGGLIAKRITDIPGSSGVFRGGVTVYTNEAKMLLLGVDEKTLSEKSAVSREVAVQLAEKVREKLGADFGLGVTGVAGPDSDGIHVVGTVFVSLAGGGETVVRALQLSPLFDRGKIRLLSANEALDMLRRRLTGLPVGSPHNY